MKSACIAILLLLAPSAAFADRQAADACAASLTSDSSAIYRATVARISPGVDVRDIVRSVTRAMVMSGTLDRAGAKPAAEAAGACLKLLRH
ncbi:hypothetical protein [Methylocapsa palsarum]|uniref:UrcA family protein n=1 Tax=Methylocapsa palsarum TaxID=1612308 RepID=A0A1I4A8F7_9HYPH|nr:hypothetical protein [Methylocapsa palsarum]SFK52241.1 hypothetical protein SAMN05444581_109128 [Methylocapsa palsarum]